MDSFDNLPGFSFDFGEPTGGGDGGGGFGLGSLLGGGLPIPGFSASSSASSALGGSEFTSGGTFTVGGNGEAASTIPILILAAVVGVLAWRTFRN